jgi:hypothetical protein
MHPTHRTMALLLALLSSAPCQTESSTPEAPQDPNAARLTRALETCKALESCAFEAEWFATNKDGTRRKVKVDPNNPLAMLLELGGPDSTKPGRAEGSWADDLLHIELDDADELLFAGRRMIARDDNLDWQLRAGRLADGNLLQFVPDAKELVAALAGMKMDVTHRQPGTVDDRPVEVLTVTLDQEQVSTLVWSGLLPTFGMPGLGMVVQMAVQVGGNGAQARPAAPRPETKVDLALAIDPGTNRLERLHFRMWDKKPDMQGGFVFVGGPGGLQAAGTDDDEEDDEADEQDAELPDDTSSQPTLDAFGLPLRRLKNHQIHDFTVRLRDQGTAAEPQLGDLARRLLSR